MHRDTIDGQEHNGLYGRLSLLGSVYVHGARYRDETTGSNVSQAAGGGGYELLMMLGGAVRQNVALGGALSLMHIPSTSVEWDQSGTTHTHKGNVMITLGPSVDYYPTSVFHVGGLLGYSNERVARFNPLAGGSENISSYAMVLWLGFDGKIAQDLGLGVVLKAQLNNGMPRYHLNRDSNNNYVEGAIALSLGVSLVYF